MVQKRSAQRAGATAVGFPTSCWTQIRSLRANENEAANSRALATLCESYWFPLYAFARHRGMSSHDSEDAVQSFFASIGDAEYFKKADDGKGKLRTFVLTGFTRHLKDLQVRASALKRGGGEAPMSLDTEQAEEWLFIDPKANGENATLAFERHWANNIIRTVIEKLRLRTTTSPNKAERFKHLSRFLNPETCRDLTPRQVADDLGITEEACTKAIQRLRNDFRVAIREEVASTLDNPNEESVMEEMIQLQKSLSEG